MEARSWYEKFFNSSIIVLAFPFAVSAYVSRDGAVNVRIISDHGSEFNEIQNLSPMP